MINFFIDRDSWVASNGHEGLICIYAPNNLAYKVFFFDNIISFVQNWDCRDFVIFGDFNCALHGEEYWGVNSFRSVSKELINLVEALHLHDLPLRGSQFTFFGSGQVTAQSRIDKSFILERASS